MFLTCEALKDISLHSCQFKKYILKNDFEKLQDKIISTFKKKIRAYTFHSTEEPQSKKNHSSYSKKTKQKRKKIKEIIRWYYKQTIKEYARRLNILVIIKITGPT